MSNSSNWLFLLLKGFVLSIIGIVFITQPLSSAMMITVYIGVLLIFGGLIAGYNVYKIKHDTTVTRMSYLAPIISLISGLLLLIFPDYALLYFALCIGFWILMDGIAHLKYANSASKLDLNFGRALSLFGVLSLLLALIIFFNPEGLVAFLTVFFGVILLIAGASLMMIGFRLKR